MSNLGKRQTNLFKGRSYNLFSLGAVITLLNVVVCTVADYSSEIFASSIPPPPPLM